MIDLDQASLDRVLPAEPEPAGWDDVLSRSHVHEGRRRRRLVVLAAVTLLLVATACAFGVRALILDKGFIGLPPEGATPSTPESGELVLQYWTGFPQAMLWVYADGRVIWRLEGDFAGGANQFSSGFLEQRLTAEGVELLRSEVVSRMSRQDEQAVSTHMWPLRVRVGGRLIDSSWFGLTSIDWKQLDTRFAYPLSWLPASAWVERKVRAYVPERYAACYSAAWDPGNLVEPSRILSALPAKAGELLAKAERLPDNPYGPVTTMAPNPQETCSVLTTAEARAVAEALHDGGFEPDDATAAGGSRPRPTTGAFVLRYSFGLPDSLGRGLLYFEPMLPHGEWIYSAGG